MQVGLPYATDPAVTKHLAAFLSRQARSLEQVPGFSGPPSGNLLRPTAVLFNGGVLKSAELRVRLMSAINRWLASDGAPAARLLPVADYDTAVAKGAAAYALARQGRGVRIRGGTARSYYVGIEAAQPAVPGVDPQLSALCVAPFGMEEGSHAKLPLEWELGVVVGEPVRFCFFGSSVRRKDCVGSVLDHCRSEELEECSPIEITLPAVDRQPGEVVPVQLQAIVTEVGTLLLEAVPLKPVRADERWRVELNVRPSPGPGARWEE
jgi:hypothetical protein